MSKAINVCKSIDVCIVTWPNHPARMGYFLRGLELLHKHLLPSRHSLVWYCSAESVPADDRAEWCGPSLEKICTRYDCKLSWRAGPPGLGENMNAAMRLGESETVLLVQDDCHLVRDLDPSPGADLLAQGDVDMIRYEWPPADRVVLGEYHATEAEIPNRWRRFDVDKGWCYGDRVIFVRRTFPHKWGPWLEKSSWQGASEGDMAKRLRAGNAVIVAADQRHFENVGKVSCDTSNARWPSNR